MRDIFSQLELLLTSDQDDLRYLADLVDCDPSTMYRGVDFGNADLSTQDLSGIDLTGANLSGARLNTNQISALSSLNAEKLNGGPLGASEPGTLSFHLQSWERKFPQLTMSEDDRKTVEEVAISFWNFPVDWHLSALDMFASHKVDYSCYHFLSFLMYRKNTAADAKTYQLLRSTFFWSLPDSRAPEFGVSKYTPDFFVAYLADSEDFRQAMMRADIIVGKYCAVTSAFIDELAKKVRSKYDLLEIFNRFESEISLSASALLSQSFFDSVDSHCIDAKVLIRLMDIVPSKSIPTEFFLTVLTAQSTEVDFSGIVETLTARGFIVDSVVLKGWVELARSFDDCFERTLTASRNNPTGFLEFGDCIGRWVTTTSQFERMKKLVNSVQAERLIDGAG